MNPSYYQLQEFTSEAVSDYLSELIRGVLGDLHEAGCVFFDPEKDTVECTALGKIASMYYIDYQTASFFKDEIADLTPEESTVQNIAFVLSHAAEFSELPVRHCEDELNAELADKLPWALSSEEDFQSPNIKTFLLLQAHFNRTPLPISDYINDTKSVLDQIPRVLNSFLDIAALQQRYDIVKALLRISQMTVQGLGEDSNSLCQLPGFTCGSASCREMSSRIRSCTSGGNKKLNLAGLLTMPEKKIMTWVNDLVEPQCRGECVQALKRLPILAVECSVRRTASPDVISDANSLEISEALVLDFKKLSIATNIGAPENYEVKLLISAEKGDPSCRVYAPRLTKPKNLSWWVLLRSTGGTDTDTPVLLGFKRIEIKGPTSTIVLPFNVPIGFDDPRLVLEITSDSVADLGISISVPIPRIDKF